MNGVIVSLAGVVSRDQFEMLPSFRDRNEFRLHIRIARRLSLS